VLVHGRLWSTRLLHRLAELLPAHHMLLIDRRGHATSDKPTDPPADRWSKVASDVVGLLDHLDIERAVVGGLSLGANVTLAFANAHPDRLRGMVVEMPVLDRAEPFARPVVRGLAIVLRLTRPVLVPATRAAAHVPVPRSLPELASLRDVLSLEPTAGSALVGGLLADHLLFEDLRLDHMDVPAIVIGHPGDPLHPIVDARELAERLPRDRFVEVRTIADLRVRPGDLAAEITALLAPTP
jgi:pimeloyl-ACP methyl ester carboxylesterase